MRFCRVDLARLLSKFLTRRRYKRYSTFCIVLADKYAYGAICHMDK